MALEILCGLGLLATTAFMRPPALAFALAMNSFGAAIALITRMEQTGNPIWIPAAWLCVAVGGIYWKQFNPKWATRRERKAWRMIMGQRNILFSRKFWMTSTKERHTNATH